MFVQRILNQNLKGYFHSSALKKEKIVFDLPELHESKKLVLEKKYGSAKSLLIRSLEVCERITGSVSDECLELKNILAKTHYQLGEVAESARLLSVILETSNSENLLRSTLFNLNLTLGKIPSQDLCRLQERIQDFHKKSPSPFFDLLIQSTKLRIHGEIMHREINLDLISKMQTQASDIVEVSRKILSGLPEGDEYFDKYNFNKIIPEKLLWYLTDARWSFYCNEDLEITKKFSKVVSLACDTKEESLPIIDLLYADAYFGIGEFNLLKKNYKEADINLRKAIELTDRYFDRDFCRVRRIIEKEAIVQYHLEHWLYAEGLFRRLMDYYEFLPDDYHFNEVQIECIRKYCMLMESRNRGNETVNARKLLERIETANYLKKVAPFDCYFLIWKD